VKCGEARCRSFEPPNMIGDFLHRPERRLCRNCGQKGFGVDDLWVAIRESNQPSNHYNSLF